VLDRGGRRRGRERWNHGERRPGLAARRMSPDATTAVPTPVSVPVMKRTVGKDIIDRNRFRTIDFFVSIKNE
jgi:hypothetical protein